jgi:CBS domain-containing protein
MKVQKLMIKDVATCRPEDSANDAAQLMWEHDCGIVPIVEDGSRVIGMVTDRDLCMASYMEGKPLRDIEVRRVMSKELWSCRPQDDLSTAEHVMREHRIRRLPVTDTKGQLKGILSLCDLAREAAKEESTRSKKVEVSYTDVAQTLGDIDEPHTRMRASRAS